jgi:hypothetical protein
MSDSACRQTDADANSQIAVRLATTAPRAQGPHLRERIGALDAAWEPSCGMVRQNGAMAWRRGRDRAPDRVPVTAGDLPGVEAPVFGGSDVRGYGNALRVGSCLGCEESSAVWWAGGIEVVAHGVDDDMVVVPAKGGEVVRLGLSAL